MQTQSKPDKYETIIANWYDSLRQIKKRNGRVAKMGELIKERNESLFDDNARQHGVYTNVLQYGVYTTAGLDYAPQNPVLLLRENSALLQSDNAEKAVQLHRNDKEYPISQDTYNSHLRQAEKEAENVPEERNILILPERDAFSINSQNHFDVLRFLAEDPTQAEKYLGKLGEKGINQINFYLRNKEYVDKQETPLTDQLWVHGVGGGFDFIGYHNCLNFANHLVLGAFPIDKASPKTAKKMYKIVQEISKGNVKLSDLESRLSQVSSFLENLSK